MWGPKKKIENIYRNLVFDTFEYNFGIKLPRSTFIPIRRLRGGTLWASLPYLVALSPNQIRSLIIYLPAIAEKSLFIAKN